MTVTHCGAMTTSWRSLRDFAVIPNPLMRRLDSYGKAVRTQA